jgi:hypothetical protein
VHDVDSPTDPLQPVTPVMPARPVAPVEETWSQWFRCRYLVDGCPWGAQFQPGQLEAAERLRDEHELNCGFRFDAP